MVMQEVTRKYLEKAKMKPIILHNHEVRVTGVVCAIISKYRYH